MAVVAGVDFGTLSVRVTLMETQTGDRLASAFAEYPLKRSAADPLLGTQSHDDQMAGLVRAMRAAVAEGGIDGAAVAALACDTTGSSVVAVDAALRPLGEYYLWCDHRAHAEAAEITELGRAEGIEALNWCGGVYSHEWGYAKLLHFLRHNPDKRDRFATALEHCDMVAATLCGTTDLAQLPRSVCAMGHKWMWGARWGGLPPQDFLSRVDPLLDGINARLSGRYLTSDHLAGRLSPYWADQMGLAAGIPIPIGAFDAHWDAIGSGARPGDVVNVVGTSTCIIALADRDFPPVPGLCGVVPGSVLPDMAGIEAGQSATGDVFEAIARRAGTTVAKLAEGLDQFGPGQTGLMRLNWDNGDRTILVRPDLGAVTLGWDLNHGPQDELHAAMEGMALHLGIVYDRMLSGGLKIARVINGGGIPGKNPVLNQIYADVLDREVHVCETPPVGIGACVFAAVACGALPDIASAQERLCPPMQVFRPKAENRAGYGRLSEIYSQLYYGFGTPGATDLSQVLPTLRSFRVGSAAGH
ncbi:MAG: ribulokinase [Cereibacter sphaeroides]|uniref:Ribulokinase n=1 Tax=Cereibacter sphaeroides TaxID=1063 RepID=A0A2W5SCK7_CERSP|nr:MAG: ribulokinase [Cereibacter sphaeroides]